MDQGEVSEITNPLWPGWGIGANSQRLKDFPHP